MFVAWPLYVLHAVLTGTSLALVNALDIKDGFGFSAGLFDFLLNWNIATKPALLIVIGIGYAIVYYFTVPVRDPKWNLRTPGPRGRRRGVPRDGGHERLRRAQCSLLPIGWSPRRGSSRRGGSLVDGDRIADVGPAPPPGRRRRSLPGATVVPGFVDAHAHGGGGASFDGGTPDDAATAVAPTWRTAPPRSWPAWSPTPRDAARRSSAELRRPRRRRAARRHPPRGAVAQRRHVPAPTTRRCSSTPDPGERRRPRRGRPRPPADGHARPRAAPARWTRSAGSPRPG